MGDTPSEHDGGVAAARRLAAPGVVARLRSLFPGALGIYAPGPFDAEAPPADRFSDLIVVDCPGGRRGSALYVDQDGMPLRLHLRGPALFRAGLARMLGTEEGRRLLALCETMWELREAVILDDPSGAIHGARELARGFLSRPEPCLARLERTVERLRSLGDTLTRLGGTSKPAARACHAWALARGVFAVSEEDGFTGLCGSVFKAMCWLSGRSTRPGGLWTRAHRAAAGLGVEPPRNPLGGVRAAHGLAAVADAVLGVASVSGAASAVEALAEATAGLHRQGVPPDEASQLVRRYESLIANGEGETALFLIRGEMAEPLATDPAYLRICVTAEVTAAAADANGNDNPNGAAAAWPSLLASLSSAMRASQMLEALIAERLVAERLTAEREAAAGRSK